MFPLILSSLIGIIVPRIITPLLKTVSIWGDIPSVGFRVAFSS